MLTLKPLNVPLGNPLNYKTHRLSKVKRISNIMASLGTSHHTGFNTLLSKSVPHILEKIFFSVDCKSFDACREVCSTWKELLASDKYQKKYDEMLIEKVDKERKLLDASANGRAKDVSQLLTYGVDPNCQQSSGDNMACKTAAPLHLAIFNNHIDVVKILLDEGADPNKKYVERTLLIMAILRNNSKIIDLLLEAGADLNVEHESGSTLLHLAARHCYKDAVEALLARGADPHKVNKKGESPLDKFLWIVLGPSYLERKRVTEDKKEWAEVVKHLLDAGAVPHEDYWDNKNYLELFTLM